MTKLSLLTVCLIGLVTPALAQASSSSSEASSAVMDVSPDASSMPAGSSEPAPEDETPMASADLFKLLVGSCTDLSSGDPTAYDRANDGGWTPNASDNTGPYNAIYSGYREVAGYGEIDIWGAVQSLPTQRLGYCRVDFSDTDTLLDFKDMAGLKGLGGTLTLGDGGNVYGAWESPDKKLLVIGDRSDGAVEIEFNLLLGDKPATK
jgi:hypothetical protein